jgi:RNA polymerase sigma-70 factor, ECF subfamily
VAPSDEALYGKMAAGDLPAFDELYLRYERRLYGFILRYLPDRAEAEDVFHEAFLGVLRSREVSLDRGSFRAWLFQIARNLSLNRIRSRNRRNAVAEKLLREAPRAVKDAQAVLEEVEAGAALKHAVQALPGTLSEVYHLRVSGMSYEEMAQVLEVPLGTIKSRMHEAVSRLKQEMKPWTAG